MPELPEAERATRLLQKYLKDGLITAVDTIEDNIVYSDISHEEFAKELTNRTVLNAHRYGKVFWLELDAPTEESRHPVFHLGMTGMIQLQGQEPVWYRVRPKDASAWPPRFMKFIIHVTPPSGPAVHVAFTDARRLGRIRLRSNPCAQPPIIDLGFDPLLSMPSLPTFSSLMLKRNMPIKALLLDQSFSAGVGNWVADEVLFHARIHPETRANELRPEEVKRVWEKVRWVCEVAVGVDSDGSRFPSDWLFRFRWGKGKKSTGKLLLPDGREGTIRWITVGGRTSAYVEEVKEPDVEEEKNAEEELVLQRKVAKVCPMPFQNLDPY
ncbi:hypothetical protein DACRYDRAFT_91738 [Dacryopinax primogenitus]|uniref:Formamidopyrimidine-DNA glycosylase catalytic domain-containing protein n=1 Tax=Dacryopinax primogenitus (strain DJM 731) TaxID=1858805 RepID=M5FPG7_DACPD|nr:uncharacterized protein DACRYDRAFT_91738 [Dacryopinax primogenitus]EJT97063.1 hypothetical protein DACRYDRAFT_91738 [Dacryopinax primogenitus]